MKPLVLAALAALLLAVPALPGAGASGGQQTFRVIAAIDAFLLGYSYPCAASSYEPPNPCFVAKNTLGYDGFSGAGTVVPDHVGHDFTCVVTQSAISVIDGTPVANSIWVGFDFNDDGLSDAKYGGRTDRPGVGTARDELANRILSLDPVQVAGYPQWYADHVVYNGPSSEVSGQVLDDEVIIWVESGIDIEIECDF